METSHSGLWKKAVHYDSFRKIHVAIGIQQDHCSHVVGGVVGYGQYMNSAFILDAQNSMIIKLPDLPNVYGGHCRGAIVNGYFYMISPMHMYRLDLSTREKWEPISLRGFISTDLGAVISDDNNIFSFDSNGNSLYGINLNEWFTLPPMRFPRWGFSTALIGQQVYIIGGKDEVGPLKLTEIFDKSSMTWSLAPPLPTSLVDASAAVIDRFIIVSGGRATSNDRSKRFNTPFCFILDTKIKKWSISPILLSSPRRGHGSFVTSEKKFVVFGGEHKSRFPFIESIDVASLLINFVVFELIRLRRLWYKGRIETNFNRDNQQSDLVIQKLIMVTDPDLFKRVLKFLTHTRPRLV